MNLKQFAEGANNILKKPVEGQGNRVGSLVSAKRSKGLKTLQNAFGGPNN